MHSPLTNFFLRPRSSRHRHRRSSSSPSSLLTFTDPSSAIVGPAVDTQAHAGKAVASGPTADHNRSACSLDLSCHIVDDIHSTSTNPFVEPPPDAPADATPSGHRCSFESPLPSPFSLNVPLSAAGAYLCTLTISSQASSLTLSNGLLYMGLDRGDVSVMKIPKLGECARFGIGSLAIKALLVTDNTIFSAHKDHKIRLWRRPDAEGVTYKLLETLPTTADYLRNLILGKRYVQIRRHHKRLWIQHVDTISAMAIDSSAPLLYSASWDRTFKVWNLQNMRCTHSVRAHDDAVNAIVVSSESDMGLIFTASADNTIKIWRKLSEKKVLQVARLDGHTTSVNALVLRQDSEEVSETFQCILYSGGSDCCINVWQKGVSSKMPWQLTATLKGHRLPVLSLSAAGALICSGGADKAIRVWRRGVLGDYTCLAILQGHRGPVKSVAIAITSLRSCMVYSSSLDSTTKAWSVLYDREDHDLEEG